MIVTLHRKQRVVLSGVHIHFQHRSSSGQKYEVVLNRRQFDNLNDILLNLYEYRQLRFSPLGGGVWLFRKGPTKKIIDNHNSTFFHFHPKSWHSYITNFHHILYTALRHGNSESYQRNALHDSRPTHRYRRSASHVPRQTLSRSPRDGDHPNGKRSEHTNVSRWKSANSRQCEREGGAKHAGRAHHEIETAQQDAAFSSDGTDSIESCDECSIEEGYMSTEDFVD